MKELLKVLQNGKISPYQKFKFQTGEVYHCDDFDTDTTKDCSRGFYAVDFNGLSYAYRPGRVVYKCQVWGKEAEYNQFKHRYEYFKLGKKLTVREIKTGLLACEESEGYKVCESVFPFNPLSKKPTITKKKALELLTVWDSVRDSVWASVEDSVRGSVEYSVWTSAWDSVRDAVGISVRDSVWDAVRASISASAWDSIRASVWASIGDSVWAYVSSLFPNIENWKYIDHEPGINPFQPGIDLWRGGYIPVFYQGERRLYSKNKLD